MGAERVFGPDIRWRADTGLTGLVDPEVLRLAAEAGRILVSQDRRTMSKHFAEYAATQKSPDIILLREEISIAVAMDELLLIWAASAAEEWTNRLFWIPL